MRCHVCNVEVGDGQKFCHECGESLANVTTRTQPLPVVGSTRDLDDRPAPSDPEPSVAPEALESDAADIPTGETDQTSAAPDPADIPTGETDQTSAAPDPADIPTGEVAAAAIAATPTSEHATGRSDTRNRLTSAPSAAPTAPEFAKTEPLDIVGASPASGVGEFDAQPATPSPPTTPPSAAASAAHEPTTTMPVVGAAPAAPSPTVTDELPATAPPIYDGIDDVSEYSDTQRDRFRLRISLVLGILTMVAALMVGVADTIDIRTSRPVDGISVGIRLLDDFGTNLAVGAYIGAGMLLIGAFVSCFGYRWGAGLAGGSGLALTGWAAITIGLIERPIHAAEGITRAAADATGFSLSVTRDLGWFLVASIGVLGFLAFVATLRMAGRGGRPGLNPWVAAFGAVGAVILAVGPLIPLGDATIDSNLGFVGEPRAFFAGRLVQLGMIAFTGVVGFLSVRTYGLGMVAGGLGIAAWLWATSIAEIGERPVGVGIGNFGVGETTPHAVTTVGLAISVVMLAVAVTLASVRRD